MIDYIERVAASPFFIGIMMLLLNIGSRYITHEFSDNDEEYRQNIILRRLAVFAVCFVGTRDLITSVLLTAGFVILASGVIRGSGNPSKEGMTNPDLTMRAVAGLSGQVDQPAYDQKEKGMFK